MSANVPEYQCPLLSTKTAVGRCAARDHPRKIERCEIAGTLGEAPDRDECEVLIEEEMEYQRLRGYIRVTAEAVELCEQCEGEGSIQALGGVSRPLSLPV
jgi:hypothetical protein